MSWIDEFKNIKSGKRQLREFGLTIGAILVILGGIALLRRKDIFPYFLVTGFIFIGCAFAIPKILKPLQKIWMGFSIVLGFFMSRIVLAILFYLVMTPINLILKVVGKDILDKRIDKSRKSYWILRPKEVKSRESYENQY